VVARETEKQQSFVAIDEHDATKCPPQQEATTCVCPTVQVEEAENKFGAGFGAGITVGLVLGIIGAVGCCVY